MTDPKIDRRNLLAAGAMMTVGAAALASTDAVAQTPAAAVGPAGRAFAPQPIALPFDPKAIAGLSERLLVSHHDNNYVGAVKRLGAITTQFASLDAAKAPGRGSQSLHVTADDPARTLFRGAWRGLAAGSTARAGDRTGFREP